MSDDGKAGSAAMRERRERPDSRDLDFLCGLAAYVVLAVATGIAFPAHADFITFLASGVLLSALRLTGWRFLAALVLAPATAMALTLTCAALFTWLTGAARPGELGTLSGWFLFTFLTWGPLLTLAVAVEMAMAQRKKTRG